MNYKKIFEGLMLSMTVISVSTISVLAANSGDLLNVDDMGKTEIMPLEGQISEEKQPYFNAFTGTVKEISDFEGIKGAKIISLENEEGMPANIIVTDSTYIVDNAEITVGAIVTGYYKGNAPMIMIYPPQYNTEVVVVHNEEQNVKVDIFDKELISSDNSLKLNIDDNSEIVLQDGKIFEGELADKKLVVSYDISTRSIPAQTVPAKIVVLFEETEEEISNVIGDVSTMDIVVNNKKIKAPSAYTNEQGTVMVPLRAIAEALGFDVTWDGELKTIRVGKGISLTIEKDQYIYMKTPIIELGTAPELVEGTTFVPLKFFKEVVGMNNAYLFESQIIIDNEESME